MELLLIDGCGGEKDTSNAFVEPLWCGVGAVAHLCGSFDFVRFALSCAISECNHASEFLAVANGVNALDLAVGKPRPTGVEPKLLCQEDELLAIVAYAFVERGVGSARHNEVVLNAREFAVGHDARESFWLVDNELDVEVAQLVALVDLSLQLVDDVHRKWLVYVVANTVSRFDSFE